MQWSLATNQLMSITLTQAAVVLSRMSKCLSYVFRCATLTKRYMGSILLSNECTTSVCSVEHPNLWGKFVGLRNSAYSMLLISDDKWQLPQCMPWVATLPFKTAVPKSLLMLVMSCWFHKEEQRARKEGTERRHWEELIVINFLETSSLQQVQYSAS